jgi:hypothetical protein
VLAPVGLGVLAVVAVVPAVAAMSCADRPALLELPLSAADDEPPLGGADLPAVSAASGVGGLAGVIAVSPCFEQATAIVMQRASFVDGLMCFMCQFFRVCRVG